MPLLLHLADVHLGAPHLDMGTAAVEQRERQRAALGRAVDEGLKAGVDAALICGDLFDSDAQSRSSVERTVGELARLTHAGVRVVIIPGCHDRDGDHSIYRAFDLARMAGLPAGSDLLTLLTPERPELLLKDLDLIIYGRVAAAQRANGGPLDGLGARTDERAAWKVGMLHASRRESGPAQGESGSFGDAEIAATGLDYLALGHQHAFSSGRAGETTWAYPGAPELVAVDEDGAGSSCLVRLADGAGADSSVHVERIRVGRTVFRAEPIDAASLADQSGLVERLAELADPDLVLQVTVGGIAADTLQLDEAEIERILAPSFLQVRVRDRSTVVPFAGLDLPADSVVGKFVADMDSRQRAAEARGDTQAADQAARILRLGRRLLSAESDGVRLA